MKVPADGKRLQNTVVIVVSALLLFQTQPVRGSGKLQISLMTYRLEYDDSSSNTVKSSTIDSNLTVPVEFVQSYESEWKLSGVFNLEGTGEISQITNETRVRWPWTENTECAGWTQYRFLLCLDYEASFDPRFPCALERIQTELIPLDRSRVPPSVTGRESITFSSLLGVRNSRDVIPIPINVEFESWKGPVRISVFIDCCSPSEDNAGQCKEVMSTTLTTSPRQFVEGTQTRRYQLSGRGSLQLMASATCDPNYFGTSCDIACRVENSAIEHKFCNSSTGRKQCLAGWEGPDCQTDIDECKEMRCRNGGTCRNTPGSYTCSCHLGTNGRYCENRYPVCRLKPCQHLGTCLETSAGGICFCMPGFTGQWCHLLEGQEERVEPQRQRVTAGTPTTPLNIVIPLTSGIGGEKAEMERSKSSQQESDSGWQHWYLAVILGVLFLLILIIIIIVVFYRTKVRKRYKVSAPLAPPSPADGSPTPQKKGRGFNNAAYQVDDPTNIIQPNSFQIIYSYNTTATNLNDNNATRMRPTSDGNGKAGIGDKIMLPSKFPAASTSGQSAMKKSASSETFEKKDVNNRNDEKAKSMPVSSAQLLKTSKDKVTNKQNEGKGKNKQKAKTPPGAGKVLHNSDDDGDDFGFAFGGNQGTSEMYEQVPTSRPTQLPDWTTEHTFPTTMSASRTQAPPDTRDVNMGHVQNYPTNSIDNDKFTDLDNRADGFAPRKSNQYTGFGQRQVDHEYEEIDADYNFHSYRPKPKPRSIFNVKSETLKRKNATNQETMVVRGSNYPPEAGKTRNGNTFDATKTNRGDPSIILGVRRGSDGCITEHSSRPYSIRYDYPRRSDGNVTYNPSYHTLDPPGSSGDLFGTSTPACYVPSYVAPSPYANDSAGIFSLPQSQDVYSNIPKLPDAPEMRTQFGNGGDILYANLGPKEYPNNNPEMDRRKLSTRYETSNSLFQTPHSLLDEKPFYRTSEDRDRPTMKFDSGGYVTSVEVMKKYGQLNSSSMDGSRTFSGMGQSPRGSQRRRKSEPFSDRLFKRSRTFELRGDKEMQVDVNWWDDDNDSDSVNDYDDVPSGTYPISSFV